MKKFILILLSVLFCVSMFSCEGDVVTLSSSEDTLSEVVSEVSSVEDISSILETSSQQSTSSETVSSVVETISADEIKADFIKVQNRLFDYEFLALDSEGVLYGYEEDTNTFDVLMKDVKDFSYGNADRHFSILKKDGKVMSLDTIYDSQMFEKATYCPPLDNVEFVFGYMAVLKDKKIKRYDYSDNSWQDYDINPKKLKVGSGEFAYIDQNDDLWVWGYWEKAPDKVAENVIEFDYSGGNKVYMSSELWYITKDHELHLLSYYPPYATAYSIEEISNSPSFPKSAVEIFVGNGYFIAQEPDGTFVYGNRRFENIYALNVKLNSVDMMTDSFVAFGENGEIYYGWFPFPASEDEEITIKCVKIP